MTTETLTMTNEQIDETLRKYGFDPDEIRCRTRALIRVCAHNLKLSETVAIELAPGEMIEFQGEVWIPARRHEQVVEMHLAKMREYERVGDALVRAIDYYCQYYDADKPMANAWKALREKA